MALKEKTAYSALASRIAGRTVDLVNRINQYLFILAVLLVYFLRFKLHINEEHYMPLAKQFYDPDWMPGSFTFNEFASTRVLYQYIAGFLLHYLSFEVASFLGVLLLCVLIAFPLLRIYELFGLSNTEIVLHLPILFLSFQSFFGGESMLLAFEPKSFGYFFALLALYNMLKENYRLSVLFIALATYFHILVGGWFMLYFLLYHLAYKRSFKATFLLGIAYAVSVAPLLIYLYPTLAENFSESHAGVNPDWIYTYFLQPFHTALFMSLSYFAKEHFEGVLATIAFFVMCIFVFNQYRQEINLRVNLFNIVLFTGMFVCLTGAYFDRTGVFVKYFPFRLNTLFAFTVFLQLTFLLRYFFLRPEVLKYFQFAVLALFFFAFFSKAAYGLVLIDVKRYATNSLSDPEFIEVAEFVRNNTARDDVVLLLPKSAVPGKYFSMDMEPTFIRRAERDWFVAFFEAPLSPGSEKINEWYQRMLAKMEIVKDNTRICDIGERYRIDYALTDYVLEDIPCCQLIFNNESYYLYRIINPGPGRE